MRVLVAMSGGVDSSVAAALLRAAGHEVVGATMKLWGGASDSGCCSVADVADARRVADRLEIAHHTFDFTESFTERVVDRYVAEHRAGRTPNPCVECNRHLKFDKLLGRALRLGFDAVATGHHARVVRAGDGRARLYRGRDAAKDQSYVLAVLGPEQLARTLLPVGEHTKAEVRALAKRLGLPTADKPESQEVCFIARRGTDAGRAAFLGARFALHPGRVLDAASGAALGRVPAVELVTVGQRRGLGVAAAPGARRYALAVDVERKEVLVGDEAALSTDFFALEHLRSTGEPLRVGMAVLAQTSAHGRCHPGVLAEGGVVLDAPARRVAPGQLVALYRGDQVLGSATAGAWPGHG